MAVDMTLKIDGVEGESQREGHTGEIDVLAFSFGMSNSANAHYGTGGGAGKVNVQDMSITKYVDKSSDKLQLKCCDGTHFATAELTVRKAGGEQMEYIKYKMEQVFITSVSTGGSGGEDRLTENITLNFAKFAYDYTPQEASGSAGSAQSMTWDIAKGVK